MHFWPVGSQSELHSTLPGFVKNVYAEHVSDQYEPNCIVLVTHACNSVLNSLSKPILNNCRDLDLTINIEKHHTHLFRTSFSALQAVVLSPSEKRMIMVL